MTNTIAGESIQQNSLDASSLLGCLKIIAKQHDISLMETAAAQERTLAESAKLSISELITIANAAELKAERANLRWPDLLKLQDELPAILLLRNRQAMVLTRIEADAEDDRTPFVVLQDPNSAIDAPLFLDERRLTSAWTGEVILIKREYKFGDERYPFGFRWIFAQILEDRRLVRDISLCAVILSLLAIMPILMWRLLLDRVMYYGNMSTFVVICMTYFVFMGYETILYSVRRSMIKHVTIKLDVKIAKHLYDKILNLPMQYFEYTPTGDILRNMGEVWKIGRFMGDNVFGSVLDATVVIFLLPIMFMYSALLTSVILALAMVASIWVVFMLPTIRRKIAAVAGAEGARGSFLVESLHGIRAVKSLALDAFHRNRWKELCHNVSVARRDEARTENLIQSVSHPLERLLLTGTGVFLLATYLLVSTQEPAYLGALIAFAMMTSRILGPLFHVSNIVVQIDEARHAVKLAAHLINQPAEEGRGRGLQTTLVGRIEFDDVTFRYYGTVFPALNHVSFAIPEGSVFGIVGRSGSGKTTVTRLLQLLHADYQGLIKIDGHDLREFDLDHLRASIGVVLQENFLFRGTIRDTISCAKPDASYEEIVEAARMAGAEEFIERLPGRYDTMIQEGSSNLSGGQRQRLAIARALIGNPRILILDEATSALDADSEAIVNANLLRIAKGRTVIIISHRLSALVEADAILVLERGRVYDIGRHDELLARCDIYSGLWHTQNRHLLPKTVHEVIPFRANADPQRQTEKPLALP